MNRIATLAVMTLLALAGLLCASCSSKSDEPRPDVPRGYDVGFFLVVGDVDDTNAAAVSRAPESGYLPGTGIENYIDIEGGKVRIGVYDLEDNFLVELDEVDITPLESYDSSKHYYLSGHAATDLSGGKFKIAILANWPAQPASMTFADIWKVKFSFVGGCPTKEQPIPFYGIKEVNVPQGLPEGVPVNLGNIHLLRAVAKIEVILDDSADPGNWTFGKLNLSYYHTEGFCAPTGITSQSQYVTGAWATDYLPGLYIPQGLSVLSDLPFLRITDKRYVVYVPEYDNHTNQAPAAKICLAFTQKPDTEHTIEVCDENGVSQDFQRNVWYRITIKKLKEDFSISVDVLPYLVKNLDPEFGIS